MNGAGEAKRKGSFSLLKTTPCDLLFWRPRLRVTHHAADVVAGRRSDQSQHFSIAPTPPSQSSLGSQDSEDSLTTTWAVGVVQELPIRPLESSIGLLISCTSETRRSPDGTCRRIDCYSAVLLISNKVLVHTAGALAPPITTRRLGFGLLRGPVALWVM